MRGGEVNLAAMTRAQMAALAEDCGEKQYRGAQLFAAVHGGNAARVEDINTLPKNFREVLISRGAHIAWPELLKRQGALDGTQKLLFAAPGGGAVEAVVIPEARRTTLCVSSQAGCALACKFCLTGQQGFARNLTAAEIVGQLRAAQHITGGAIRNVVFMGMGEPLLNLDAVVAALQVMTDAQGLNVGRRRVTVSTAGVAPAMIRLRDLFRAPLAVSLHAADDELRSEIMPINKKYPLAELMDACAQYISGAPRETVTMEYVMLDGINDSDLQARQLARLTAKLRAKINLIPFNAFPAAPYRASPRARLAAFYETLRRGGAMVTIRRPRGDDILAACGQLAGALEGPVRRGLLPREESPLLPAAALHNTPQEAR